MANEEHLARTAAAEAAVARLEEMVDESRNDPVLYEARQAAAGHIIPLYRQRILASEANDPSGQILRPVLQDMRKGALEAERKALSKLLRQRKINDTTMRTIVSELTLSEALTEKHRK